MAKRTKKTPIAAHRARRKKTQPPPLFLGLWLARLGREQTEVAKAAGIGKSYVSLIVSGKRPNPAADKLLKISREMGVTVNDLYEPPPSKDQLGKLRQFRPEVIEKLLEADS